MNTLQKHLKAIAAKGYANGIGKMSKKDLHKARSAGGKERQRRLKEAKANPPLPPQGV